jgi:alkylation response protein AidB-like acyl-CoA dehydrogenase
MELDAFRRELDAWLDDHADELARSEDGEGDATGDTPAAPDVPAGQAGDSSLDAEMAHLSRVKRLAYDAGWMRWGWPERVGGLGGSPLLRGYLGEALTARDLVEPGIYSMTEVLAPTMIDFAPPDLAAEMVPRLLRGDETWCQGFSEPGTGSNLAALSCRAVQSGDGGGWRVNGQKVWTSLAQYAQRCILLTRTGTPESAHRGITAFFVDMDTPGITVRPIETMHGRLEFCEVFFDDMAVPDDRRLGDVGQGWAVAMDLLPYERSTALWHRGAFLHQRLNQLLDQAPSGALDPAEVGEVAQQLFALRGRSRATQHRLAAGERLGPETSIDKILLATAEQAVFDLAAAALPDEVLLGEDPTSSRWRSEYLYSRAATIYGGSAEIQRNIVARRLLDLGADR